MSLDRIKAVAVQILNRVAVVSGKGEQATKQSLVLPMIDALGYDIWDPAEVCPEYEADFAIKKQGQKEKVDIAVFSAGVPRVYFETKPVEVVLDGHEGQLARYFNATPTVTLGILTNGVEWRFYTDTGDPNVMDSQPFHTVNLNAVDQGLEVLVRFAKPVFSPEAIRDYATELRYTADIAAFLRNELDLKDRDPSEHFLRWILKADRMYDGVVNANVLERFRPITKAALTRVIREIVRRSITAMEEQAAQGSKPDAQPAVAALDGAWAAVAPLPVAAQNAAAPGEPAIDDPEGRKIVTTEVELEAFAIVKEIFERSPLCQRQVFDPAKRKCVPLSIAYKDTTGYLGIYLNKPGWWAARVVSHAKTMWIGFDLDEAVAAPLIPPASTRLTPSPWAAVRVEIQGPADIRALEKLVLASIEKVIREHAIPTDSPPVA